MTKVVEAIRQGWDYLLHLLHVLGLGIWLGTLVFFPFCVALPVIDGMQALASRADNWLGLQTQKEGIRLAGEFLDIVFQRYFLFQLGCGLTALLSALAWWRLPGKVHTLRLGLLVVAVILVATNEWWLAQQVRYWRQERYTANPAEVTSVAAKESAGDQNDLSDPQMSHADSAFQFWHNWSLGVDLATLVLVFSLMLLVPFVPSRNSIITSNQVSRS